MERARGGSLILVLAGFASCSGDGVLGGGGDCRYALVERWPDLDGDQHGAGEPESVCPTTEGYSNSPVDCDDTDPEVHPGAAEACNGRDDDCDGQLDNGLGGRLYYTDADGDSFGARYPAQFDCVDPGDGWVKNADDCDDDAADVNPDGNEVCNGGIDDDCNNVADDNDPALDPAGVPRWYSDGDGDGYGDPAVTLDRCAPLAGYLADDSDCDDVDAEVSPDAVEIPGDGVDENCNGLEGCYADADADGARADTWDEVDDLLCLDPSHAPASFPVDCDDNDPTVSVVIGWYEDRDNDGFGAGNPQVESCLDPGGGLVPETPVLDCDDQDPDHSPATPEVCDDLLDQNCDLLVDCADATCGLTPTCKLPCADVVLESIVPQTVSSSTNGQNDDIESPCGLAGGAPEIAYQWAVPVTGNYVIDTAGSAYDTILYVYDGCGGAQLACNDDVVAGNLQSEVVFQAQEGQILLIVVDGYNNASGQFDLHIN